MKCAVTKNELNGWTKILKSGKQVKRRGILTIQAFIITVALVMASGVSAFAGGNKGVETDPRKILTDNLIETADSFIDMISLSAGTQNLQTVTKISGVLDYKTEVNEAGLSNLLSALEAPQEMASIVKLFLDAGVKIGFEFDVSGIDPLINLGIGLTVQNESLLNLESTIKKNVLYFGIAELYSQYFAVELDDYDMDVKDLIDGTTDELMYQMDMDSYTQTLADMQPFFDYVATYENDLKAMLHEIIMTAVDEIDEVGYYDAMKVELNGKNVKCGGVSFDLTEVDAYNMSVAVSNLLLNNRDYMRMVVDVVNLSNGYKAITVSDLKEELEYFLEDESGYYSDEVIEISLYTDSDGNTMGFNITADDGEMKYLADIQNGFEFMFDNDGEIVRMYGSLAGELSDLSGDLWVDFSPGELSYEEPFDIKILEFEGLNLDVSDAPGEQEVTLTFLLGELMAASGDDIFYDVPVELVDYLLESKLVVTMSGTESTSAVKMELLLGDDISMMFNLNLEVGAELSGAYEPTSSDVLYVDDTIMEYIDFDALLENINKVMEKIEGMGYDIDLLYDLLDSTLSEALNP